jgi:hypothetical protein
VKSRDVAWYPHVQQLPIKLGMMRRKWHHEKIPALRRCETSIVNVSRFDHYRNDCDIIYSISLTIIFIYLFILTEDNPTVLIISYILFISLVITHSYIYKKKKKRKKKFLHCDVCLRFGTDEIFPFTGLRLATEKTWSEIASFF